MKRINEELVFENERWRMVEEQLANRDIHDPRVLEAMRSVPRHYFVPGENRRMAYADGPLPIGRGQTISQPYIVALMTQLLELQGDETVLEIGTGSGYQAAILARLAFQVHTIERHAILARRAVRTLDLLNYSNVKVHFGDGSLGLKKYAPYDAIIVTAAAPQIPQPLFEQLTADGVLVIPVGERDYGFAGCAQYLERWRPAGAESGRPTIETSQVSETPSARPLFRREVIAPVAFVPLLGELGWAE